MLTLNELFRQTPPHSSVPSALDYTIEVIEAVSDSMPGTTQHQLTLQHHLAQTVLILKACRKLHKLTDERLK